MAIKQKETTREKLINVIFETSGDELETRESILKMAAKSEDELIDEVISILYYYKNEADSND